jgi:hypothetical protein
MSGVSNVYAELGTSFPNSAVAGIDPTRDVLALREADELSRPV